jgi:hypothetical protein
MVPSAPVTPEVVETPVVTAPAAEVAAAPAAAPVAAEAAVPSAEVAVTAQAEAPECLITVADSTSPAAVAIAGFAILGVVVKLFLGNKKKKKAAL